MLLINELFPNPKGKDTEGEFIELKNTNDSAASIEGFALKTPKGKTYILKGEISAHGLLVLPYQTTKLTITNENGDVLLYGASGALLDRVSYVGSAKEGASFARNGETFFFTTTPTPGKENVFSALFPVSSQLTFPSQGSVISPTLPFIQIILFAVLLGVSFSFLVHTAIKKVFV